MRSFSTEGDARLRLYDNTPVPKLCARGPTLWLSMSLSTVEPRLSQQPYFRIPAPRILRYFCAYISPTRQMNDYCAAVPDDTAEDNDLALKSRSLWVILNVVLSSFSRGA